MEDDEPDFSSMKIIKTLVTAKARKINANNWSFGRGPMRKKVKPDDMSDAEFTWDILENGTMEPDPDNSWDLESSHSIELEEELAKILAEEIDQEILNDLRNAASKKP